MNFAESQNSDTIGKIKRKSKGFYRFLDEWYLISIRLWHTSNAVPACFYHVTIFKCGQTSGIPNTYTNWSECRNHRSMSFRSQLHIYFQFMIKISMCTSSLILQTICRHTMTYNWSSSILNNPNMSRSQSKEVIKPLMESMASELNDHSHDQQRLKGHNPHRVLMLHHCWASQEGFRIQMVDRFLESV